MKGKILTYALIFTILLIIYQYINATNAFENSEQKISKLSDELKKYKDSVATLADINADLNYFSLENNGEALAYFDDLNIDGNISRMIEDAIYDKNSASADNPLVPFEGLNGHFAVNKVKVLNNKWIVCSFTDGTYWGEMLLRYEFNDQKELTLEVLHETLHQQYKG